MRCSSSLGEKTCSEISKACQPFEACGGVKVLLGYTRLELVPRLCCADCICLEWEMLALVQVTPVPCHMGPCHQNQRQELYHTPLRSRLGLNPRKSMSNLLYI